MTTAALKSCVCSIPRPRTNPGHEETCVVCGWRIPPEWGSENIEGIFDRLEQAFPAGVPDAFKQMRALCEAREQDGRRHFGFRFHGRDGFKDGREEASDWINYDALEIIKARKDGNEELEDAILNAMMKIFEAVEAHRALGIG